MRHIGWILLLLVVLTDCSSLNFPTNSKIRIKGSDTMIILLQQLAKEYMRTHPGVSVYTEGGGTGSGIKALIKGEVEICSASRPLRPNEVQGLAAKYGAVGVSFLVAKDALSIYLHPENPVKNLTINQLRNIFSGELRNWKGVGGGDTSIVVIVRPPNSGTFLYFKDHVLEGKAYTNSAVTLPTTEKVVQYVRNHSNAIGYGGIAYGPDLVHSKVNSISVSEENIRQGEYPISRYLYLYTVNKPGGAVKEFIDWIMGPMGQNIVRQVGYVPLWERS